MAGLPDEAVEMLTQLMVRICEDPYDRLFSKAFGKDARERMSELGDFGYVEFTVDEAAQLVRIHVLVWIG
jgi:hypothetical protein